MKYASEGFETQGRYHQNSKTEVSVAPQKGLMSSKVVFFKESNRLGIILPPANEVCEGYVFTRVCPSTRGECGIPVCLAGGISACLAGLQGGLQAHIRADLQVHIQGEGVSRPTPGGGGLS